MSGNRVGGPARNSILSYACLMNMYSEPDCIAWYYHSNILRECRGLVLPAHVALVGTWCWCQAAPRALLSSFS